MITTRQVVQAYYLVKAAQLVTKRHAPPKAKRRAQPAAYPDYSKSLVRQMEVDPLKAGLLRAGYTTPLGAILGGLIGYLAHPEDLKGLGIGAGAGALAGGIPGFLSGSREAESEKTRLLALRRLGIETPGELSIAEQFPETLKQLLEAENT